MSSKSDFSHSYARTVSSAAAKGARDGSADVWDPYLQGTPFRWQGEFQAYRSAWWTAHDKKSIPHDRWSFTIFGLTFFFWGIRWTRRTSA